MGRARPAGRPGGGGRGWVRRGHALVPNPCSRRGARPGQAFLPVCLIPQECPLRWHGHSCLWWDRHSCLSLLGDRVRPRIKTGRLSVLIGHRARRSSTGTAHPCRGSARPCDRIPICLPAPVTIVHHTLARRGIKLLRPRRGSNPRPRCSVANHHTPVHVFASEFLKRDEAAPPRDEGRPLLPWDIAADTIGCPAGRRPHPAHRPPYLRESNLK